MMICGALFRFYLASIFEIFYVLRCLKVFVLNVNDYISLAHYIFVHILQEQDKIDKNEEEEGPSLKRPHMEVESKVAKRRKLTRFPLSIQVRNRPSSRGKRARFSSRGCRVKGGIHDIRVKSKKADNSFLSKVPPEVFHDILKFLSSEVGRSYNIYVHVVEVLNSCS